VKGGTTAKVVAAFVALFVVGLCGSVAAADDGPLSGTTGADSCAASGAEQLTADYAGGTLTVTGSGFSHLCDMTVRTSGPANTSETGTASADLSGSFTYTESLSGPTGLYQVDALGFGGATLASASFSQTLGGTTSSLIVKLASGLSSSEQDAVIARDGGTETKAIAPLRLHVIDVASGDVDATLARYQSDTDVVSAERDKTRDAGGEPSDPGYASQWALQQIGWNNVFGTVDVSGSAKLAVLDTGVSSAGGDLQVGPGWSAFGGDAASDPNGHGTWVASIAAAAAGNGVGIAGVSFANTTVFPVQVLDSSGVGQDSDIIEGVLWAADNGADVILMSFSNPGFSPALQDAIDYAWSQGAVVVAATGNGGSADVTYPAGDAGVIGVSATDQSDALTLSSNYGADTFLAAPGVGIAADNQDGGTTAITGTSASAALVAGAAALLKAKDGSASNGVIVGRLARNADPAGSSEQTGNGRLNLERAIGDTSTDQVKPAGAAPVGDGGPFVGPYVTAAAATSGDGTMTVSPTSVAVSSTGNNLQFTFTAVNDFNNASLITVAVPANWSAPQTSTPAGAGYVTITNVSCETTGPTVSVSGSTITATVASSTIECKNTNQFKINYSNVTAPSSASLGDTFTTSSRAGSTGSPVAIGSSPAVAVLGPATQLKITSVPVSVVNGATSSAITVQQRDTAGNPVNAGVGGVAVNLVTDSGTGTFRDAGDTTNITSVAIPSGSSSASFKYKDTTIGTPTITVSATGLTPDSRRRPSPQGRARRQVARVGASPLHGPAAVCRSRRMMCSSP
jgi:hypothetical protein